MFFKYIEGNTTYFMACLTPYTITISTSKKLCHITYGIDIDREKDHLAKTILKKGWQITRDTFKTEFDLVSSKVENII